MTKAILTNANLSEANLTESNFSHAFMNGVNLTKADLTNANLSNTDLKRANLTGINLTSTLSIKLEMLKNTVLSSAKVTKFDLRNSDLSKANLSYADLSNVDMTNTDLTGSNLLKANLSDTDLRWADLTDANLSGANLTRANLNDADLNRTNLMDTILKDAKLLNVKNMDKSKKEPMSSILQSNAHTDPIKNLHSAGNDVVSDSQTYSPGMADVNKDVKIWGLELEGFGKIHPSFQEISDLTKKLEGLSDIEANLLKHRMFSDKHVETHKNEKETYGVLYSVNFVPATKEIPIEIKWISPGGKTVRSTISRTPYLERQLTAYSFEQFKNLMPGTWSVKFYHDNRLIGEQSLIIGNKKALRSTTKKGSGKPS